MQGLLSFTSLPIGGCWPSSGPRHQSLSELGLGAAAKVHICAQLAWPAMPKERKAPWISLYEREEKVV